MWPAALAGGVDAGERLDAAGQGHITRAFDGKVLPPTHQERGKLSMLERYFVKPTTIDRIRGSWMSMSQVPWNFGGGPMIIRRR
jgi:hypothetical protein